MNGKEVVERALSLGEAVHGSEKEKAILKLIEGSSDREVKRVPVRTKVWEVKEFHVRVNGREVEASLLPTREATLRAWQAKTSSCSICSPTPSRLSRFTKA